MVVLVNTDVYTHTSFKIHYILSFDISTREGILIPFVLFVFVSV